MLISNRVNQKGFSQIVILIILVVGLLATLYLSQRTQIFKPRAYEANTTSETDSDKAGKNTKTVQEISSLTNQLLLTIDRSEGNSADLDNLASKRYVLLSELAETDPTMFLKVANLTENRVPQEVQKYVEQSIKIQGRVRVNHIHKYSQNQTQETYSLDSLGLENSKSFNLIFTDTPPSLISGSLLEVSGIELGSELVVLQSNQNITGDSNLPDELNTTPINDLTRVNILAILYKFQNHQNLTASAKEIEEFIFSNQNSIKAFYEENSQGQFTIFGKTTTPYEISSDGSKCTPATWFQLAEEEALKDNINFLNYDVIMYIPLEPTPACGMYGTYYYTPHSKIKNTIVSSSFRDNVDKNENRNRFISANSHELGHMLGPDHANSVSCNDKTIDTPDNCINKKYGDYSDIMGQGNSYDNPEKLKILKFNAIHQVQVKWIRDDQIKLVSQDGIYTITPLELKNNQFPKILKIPLNNPVGSKDSQYYFISYRQPLGFDHNINPIFTDRVSIHTTMEPTALPTGFATKSYVDRSLLSGLVATLVDEKVYYDPFNHIKILQLNHNEDTAQLEIKLNYEPE